MRSVFAAILLIVGISIVYNLVPEEEVTYQNINVVVYRGETLWEIAGEYADVKEDLREVIYRIKKANNLETADIFAGQRLIIPVKVQLKDELMLAKATENNK